ncbi:MAG: alpha-hydroxy-acid oxidizing protein [Mesorhizobium sp.]|nr:MAG: alpha-hydroxy-acid oxidizing protein [Mesorhizobium sp.]
MIRLGLANAATIEALAWIARRRMPAIACGYLESGTGAELALARNRAALDAITLAPRYMRDTSGRSTAPHCSAAIITCRSASRPLVLSTRCGPALITCWRRRRGQRTFPMACRPWARRASKRAALTPRADSSSRERQRCCALVRDRLLHQFGVVYRIRCDVRDQRIRSNDDDPLRLMTRQAQTASKALFTDYLNDDCFQERT